MTRTITGQGPFNVPSELRSEFDRLFGKLSDGHHGSIPAIDMIREGRRLIVRAEVPGIEPEEIEIRIDGATLTISGKHEESSEEKRQQFVQRERRYGAFARTIVLPAAVEPKKIKATTHDGVLEITVPLRKEAAAEPVTITPTAGG